ncbi:MAG TPA: polysaccharide biosynthesis/export family protein [Pyrinomonadaceae bacterium]|nr:polysaccharide biosynthesis/export family protein [Pyrinomonadaceae bacterium]
MKAILKFNKLTVIALSLLMLTAAAFGQTDKLKDPKKDGKKGTAAPAGEKPIPMPAPSISPDSTGSADDSPESEAILPYYNNYLKEYRLGPGDVITVEVFGQCPDYCKPSIAIPPNARISYPLVREGVLVAGKTVEQVAAEITKKLDEFIIDPKVTVTLDKAMATRYSVMGNVAAPGVRVMDRKVSVYEAILDAGGVSKTGDKNKVAVVSYGKDGRLSRRVVSLADMEAGKAEMVYLSPGDQVFVAGKGFSLEKVLQVMSSVSSLRYMVGSPL